MIERSDLDLDRPDPIELLGRDRAIRIGILLLVLGLSGLLVFGGALAGIAPAAAQESESGSSEDPSGSEGNVSTATQQLDQQVRVGEYSYDAEREIFTIELQHTAPEGEIARITATELVSESGAGSFGVRQLRLSPGETVEIEVSVKDKSGSNPGVMIVSQRSLQEGSGVYLIEESSLGIFTGDATWSLVRVSAVGAIGGLLALLLGMSWLVISSKDSDYTTKI